MPASVVRTPEEERLWDKAKRQAAKQGRAGDYAYIMGIFKRMTGRKSTAQDLGKSFVIAPAFRQAHIGGQVPRRSQRFDDQADAVRALLTKPRPVTPAMLLDHTEPRMTARSVMSNLGLDQATEESWRRFVEENVGGTDSEVTARQKLYAKIREERLGPELGRALGQRAMSYWRGMRKSAVLVLSADELLKAIGHKYIRRVPKPGGGYRYYYREGAAAREATAGEDIKLGRRTAKVLEVGEDGSLTIELDGQRRRVSPDQWHDLLTRHYGRAFSRSAERRSRQAVNAVLRHVPRRLLEDLQGTTDEQRLAELEKRVPAIYARLHAAFRRAGLSPFAAKRVLSRTLERRGWEAEARALVIGSVIRFRELGTRELIDASENLAGGKHVEARHVATVLELRAPSGRPAAFAEETANLAEQAERELAELSTLLAHATRDKGAVPDALATSLASTALQKLNLLTQAFPGLQDRVAEKARDILPQMAALAPRRQPTRDGAETLAYVAGEGGKPKALAARYRLVEADELIASHDPNSFARRRDYPADVQERAYHRDKSEQAKVIRNAQQLNPRFVVNTNPDAVNGPPLVTDDGIVLGGNSRVMSMQRVYSQHPESATALREYLANHAQEVGLVEADVLAMKNPVLIREVVPEDKSKRGLQLLVRQMNESFTQGMDPRTMQVAMGRKLSDNDLQSLAGEMQEDETLNAFLAGPRSERFVGALFRAGVVDSRNASQYLTRGTRTLNNDGRTLVSRILVGRIVQDADVLSDTGAQMLESIARAVPAMVQAKSHGAGYDIGDDLRVAIDAFNDLQRRVDQGVIPALDPKMTDRRFGQLFNYFMVLPGIGEPHPVLQNDRARLLLEVLVRKRGPVQMSNVFREYAKRAAQNPEGQITMFGAKSPDEILAETVQDALGKRPTRLAASMRERFFLVKAGPFIGPRGGRWADPQHTIPWDPTKHEATRVTYPKRLELEGGRYAKLESKGARFGDYRIYEKGRFVGRASWSALERQLAKPAPRQLGLFEPRPPREKPSVPTDPAKVTKEQMDAAFPARFAEVDWGDEPRGQGKRQGMMVLGAMSDAPRGKKRYLDLAATYKLDEEDATEVGALRGALQLAYRRARTAGRDHDGAMRYVHDFEESEGKPATPVESEEHAARVAAYEAKQDAKRERYQAKADKLRREATARFRAGDLREEVSGIPLGQPILAGHHSEKRHRRAIERANANIGRGIEAQKRAERYERKAAAVGKAGISSDDPEAVVKLKKEIAEAEQARDQIKAINRAYRKYGDDWARVQTATGASDKLIAAAKNMEPGDKQPFPSYLTTNLGANIRRMRERVDLLLEAAARPESKPIVGKGYRIEEDKADNRIRFYFEIKPTREVTQKMKRAGFRWSPSNGAWQRHLNNAGRYAAERMAKELFGKSLGYLLVTPGELLEKAEARGGKYHRRVPRPGGGYRYFYDPEQYARHESAHVSGDEAARAAIRKVVGKHLEEAGDRGCPIERLQPLVQRYGAKVVGAVLSADVKEHGKLRFENGKLFAKSERYLPRSA